MINNIELIRGVMRRDSEMTTADIPNGPMSGIVSTLDPITQTVKVILQPSGVETGYLKLKTISAGNGWGIFAPPIAGTVVDVHFEDGDIDSGWVGLHSHNDVDKPLPVPGGEIWFAHSNGLRLMFTNDGKVTLGGNITGVGIVQLGNTGDLHSIVKDTFMQLFNTHTHPANNTAPSQKMTVADHLTKEVKAS